MKFNKIRFETKTLITWLHSKKKKRGWGGVYYIAVIFKLNTFQFSIFKSNKLQKYKLFSWKILEQFTYSLNVTKKQQGKALDIKWLLFIFFSKCSKKVIKKTSLTLQIQNWAIFKHFL